MKLLTHFQVTERNLCVWALLTNKLPIMQLFFSRRIEEVEAGSSGPEEGSVRPDSSKRAITCERGSGFSTKLRDLIVFTLPLIYEGTHHFNITQPVMNKQYLISSLLF